MLDVCSNVIINRKMTSKLRIKLTCVIGVHENSTMTSTGVNIEKKILL